MAKRTPSQRGKTNRTSGHTMERQTAILLRDTFPDAKRGYQSRGGTSAAPDVDGTPFYIECKHELLPNIPKALMQAELGRYKVSEEGTKIVDKRPPVAITKRKKAGPYKGKRLVTMRFEDWLELVARAEGKA